VELRHLRSFIAVAEERHFGRAARRLGIPQPPLSQLIRALEEELGARLFDRTSRSVALTAVGQVFLRDTQAILRQIEEATGHARRAGRGEAGHLDIGYCTTATYLVFPEALCAFRTTAPSVDVRLHELASAAQLAALAERRIDAGFVAPPLEAPPDVDVEVIASDPLVVALPEGHPLAERRRIRPADLQGEPMVTVRRDVEPVWADACNTWLRAAGVAPRLVQEPDSKLAVLGLVSAGIGIALVTASLADVRRAGVVFRPFSVPTVRLGLGLALARPASPAALRFAEVVRAVSARDRRRGRS